MQSGTETSGRRDALVRPSVASKLVELGTKIEPNEKTWWMVSNLICLKIEGHGRTPRLRKVSIDITQRTDYIAVSYPWTPSLELEELASGSYTVIGTRYPMRRTRRSKVRDLVLDRVINYANALGIELFWIDRECIGQKKSNVKQLAMNSMDLVYGRGEHPLGLLAVELRTQGQLEALLALLSRRFLAANGGSYPELQACYREVDINYVLELLELLSRDKWWSRAWIFQEEYVSSIRMHLLIRYLPDLAVPIGLDCVSGEIRINASDFREDATRFLLAVQELPSEVLRVRCDKLLRVFGKYNVQHRYQNNLECRTMSSRVLADIGRRGITEPYDLLSIAANSCDYALRLDSDRMKETGYHVNLCVVAMCLANGELIRDSDEIRERPDEMELEQCLRHVSFDRFRPPVLERELSYLKTCRLRDVSLRREGIRTLGHLWTVIEEVSTEGLQEHPRMEQSTGTVGLTYFERKLLYSLLWHLEGKQRYSNLVGHLRHYLHDGLSTHDDATFAREHKDQMAGAIANAIHNRKPLFLVQHSVSSPVSGILTGLNSLQSRAFTSWWCGEDRDGKVRCSRMSLEVEVEQSPVPLLRAVQWVNGLVFFKNLEASTVAFRWPEAWIRTDL